MTFLPNEHQQRLIPLLAGSRNGVLVTLKRDGRPQLSNISYHFDRDSMSVAVSVTADRAKTRNVQRDPRVSMQVSSPDFWSWLVIEGDAELSAVATSRDDEAVQQLVELYRAINGEHPDWDDYRAAMVRDRRQVLRLPISHLYGQPPAR
jgi:PPOX class probable F420-dependent enzyme